MVEKYQTELGVRDACKTFGLPEAIWYRHKKAKQVHGSMMPGHREKTRNHRRLSEDEEKTLMEIVCEERFMDMAPEAIVACLLDEGKYYASARTIYRLLERHKAVHERRNQLKHPEYKKPELLATAPNQLWTWDITKLRTGRKHDYFQLYVIIDVLALQGLVWVNLLAEAG